MNNKDPASNNNPAPNNAANHEYLNPINILGIPSRSNHDTNTRHGAPPPPSSQEQNHKMNFKIFKSSSRCGMGSLLNLHKIPSKTSLQRSNSARECGMLGPVLGGGHVNTNITNHTLHINAGSHHRNGVAADFNNYTDRLQVSCG